MRDIKIDYVSNTIIVTKVFLEAASTPYSEESITLQNLQREFPNMRIATRNLQRRNIENPYKGLTYKFMRNYIKAMDEPNLCKFQEAVMHFETFTDNKTLVYTQVRDWFIAHYPDYRELIISTAPKLDNNIVSIHGSSLPPAA